MRVAKPYVGFTRALSALCFAGAASACGSAAPVRAGPIIPPLAISVSPQALTLAPGQSAVLTARARGGEAMRLFVDWTIQEGDSAGVIKPVQEETDHGSSITFTASAARTGTVHLVASIRHFPSVNATVTVNLSGKSPAAN